MTHVPPRDRTNAVVGGRAPSERPLRVLHVVSHFPPDRIGGVGEVAAHLHRGLLARGHDSHVLTSGVTMSDPRVRRVAPGPGAGFTLRVGRFADVAARFDVVHAHHGEALPLLLALRRAPTRTVMTLHVDGARIARAAMPARVDGIRLGSWGTGLRQGFALGGAKLALDAVARRVVDEVTFISSAGAIEVTGDTSGATVIHNGVAAVPDDGPAAPPVELLYVGTAGGRKRTGVLGTLLERVRGLVPDTRLRVVGFDAASEPALVADLERRGLRHAVEFVGPIGSESLGPHYRSAGLLVVPSVYEGLPMVVLEAMNHGVPVVATDAGGTAEAVVDRVTGRVVPVDDLEALAAACATVLADRDLAAAMGAAGRERVRAHFGVETQVRRHVELYERLTA